MESVGISAPLSALVISANPAHRRLLQERLAGIPEWPVQVQTCRDQEETLRKLSEAFYDLVFLDAGSEDLSILERIRQLHPKSAVVLVAEAGNEKLAVSAIKKGAADYLTYAELGRADLAQMLRRVIETRYLAGQNMELRQVNQMKNEFIANVSHELRTPLSVIIGYAEALRQGTLGPVNEAQGKALGSILFRSEGLLRTLNQILRIRDGRAQLLLGPLDLGDFLSRQAAKPDRELERKKMRLETRLEATPVWVRADPDTLAFVVENLLSNAAKFGPEGGTIALSLVLSDGKALIGVKDQGPGISPEMLPRLFERFSAASLGPTREHAGLGLGLPLSKQIVEQHAGRLWLESPGPGQGCSAFVALPLASPESPGLAVEAEASCEKKRILIVEDNPEIIDLLQLFMASLSHNLEISTACSGFEALQSVQDLVPHLIILDIIMPGMDGFQVIERLRKLPKAERIPIMVLTGYAEALPKARLCGVAAVLQKPFEKDVFVQKLNELLLKKREE